MTREDIIRWAREAGLFVQPRRWFYSLRASMDFDERVERFAALVAAAERERMTVNSIHSCHPECDRPGCVAVRKAVEVEREACAEIAKAWDADHPETNYGRCIAAAIEARGSK